MKKRKRPINKSESISERIIKKLRKRCVEGTMTAGNVDHERRTAGLDDESGDMSSSHGGNVVYSDDEIEVVVS